MLQEHGVVFKANPPPLNFFSLKTNQRHLLTTFELEGGRGVGNERKLCGGQDITYLSDSSTKLCGIDTQSMHHNFATIGS